MPYPRTRMICLLMAVTTITVACLLASPAQAQELTWAKKAVGASDDVAAAIAVDDSGNSYIAGYFRDTITFGSGETNQTTLTSAGEDDLFVAKYDANGSLHWAKRAGGGLFDAAVAIAVDDSGNSYLTGWFKGSATFGAGEVNQITLTASGDNDIFVAKYNASGSLRWAKRAGGVADDRGASIAIDANGNSHVTGWFEESATFGAGEANQTTWIAAGGDDIFIAKYDTNGLLLWAKKAGGTSSAGGQSIGLDELRNSYVAGHFQDTAIFGYGETNQTNLASTGDWDIFVAKFDANGSLLWARKAGSIWGDRCRNIGVDGNGNSYVTGGFSNVATFGDGESNETNLTSAGSLDIFIAKYDTNGLLRWAKRAGSTSGESGQGISTDRDGNSYLTGYFSGMATFGADEANEIILTAAGGSDTFVAKYNASGLLRWVIRVIGAYSETGRGIAVDRSGNSHWTGRFHGAAILGIGEVNETTLTGVDGTDFYVAKLTNDHMLYLPMVPIP